ncbi:MAG: hypothetical protein OXD01_00580 [Gammaproteobacteria bacterium]|nr:hypothetical protein [Gammaproteobacteria bacterium]
MLAAISAQIQHELMLRLHENTEIPANMVSVGLCRRFEDNLSQNDVCPRFFVVFTRSSLAEVQHLMQNLFKNQLDKNLSGTTKLINAEIGKIRGRVKDAPPAGWYTVR